MSACQLQQFTHQPSELSPSFWSYIFYEDKQMTFSVPLSGVTGPSIGPDIRHQYQPNGVCNIKYQKLSSTEFWFPLPDSCSAGLMH